MTAAAQSLSEFRTSAEATIDRLNRTGEPEAITIDGQVRAVLVSPAAFQAMTDEAQLARDAAVIRRSLRQYRAGEGQELHAFSRDLRARLTAMGDGSDR